MEPHPGLPRFRMVVGRDVHYRGNHAGNVATFQSE